MAKKKLSISIGEIILWLVLGLWLSSFLGCASPQSRKMSQTDNTRVQQSQSYPCPSCGFSIPDKDISSNIRMENKCPSCGKVFFGKPVVVAKKEKYAPYGPYGPRNYGPMSTYQSDVSYQRFGSSWYSFKKTPYGFSERSWYFYDSRTKTYRVTPHWITTRYHYP